MKRGTNGTNGAIGKAIRGVTLIELVVAVGVLSVVILPLFSMFTTGMRVTAIAERVRLANYEAQLRFERLIGRPWVGDLEFGPVVAGNLTDFPTQPRWNAYPHPPLSMNSPDQANFPDEITMTHHAAPFTTEYTIRWSRRDSADATEGADWYLTLLEVTVRVLHDEAPGEWSRPMKGVINVAPGGF